MTRAGIWSCLLAILGLLHTGLAVRAATAAAAESFYILSGFDLNNPLARLDGSDESNDSDEALIILFILATAVCGALVGIGVVFIVFYTATIVVQRFRRFVYGLDEDGVSERVRNQLLTDEDSRQSYELGRAFERQYPYGSVNTQLTAGQQAQIREKGVDAWEFVVNVDVNAMLQSKTEVLFMGGENCVQTNLPLPKSNAVYYFEVKLVEKPMDVNMWIGLATRPYPAWRMTGWNKYSTGYCTNNGSVHQNSPFKAARIGERLFVGDILGIGYQPRSGVVWFTRNGRRYKEIVSGMLYDLFPTISADGPCSFSANFGQRGFVFIEANVKRWGLGPVEGSILPPPVYGANQNTILLETATSPSPLSDDEDEDSHSVPANNTVILIDDYESTDITLPRQQRQGEGQQQNSRHGRRQRTNHRPPLYQKEDPIAAQLLEAGSTSLEPVVKYRVKQPESPLPHSCSVIESAPSSSSSA